MRRPPRIVIALCLVLCPALPARAATSPKLPPKPAAKAPAKPAPVPETDPAVAAALRAKVAAALAPAGEVVFAQRVSGTDHWYVNFGFYACPTIEYPANQSGPAAPRVPGFKEGGRLCALNLRTGAVRVLLDDPRGGVRDPAVDYDARRIVFSYRPGGTERFHLYEIATDGTGLHQLTRGDADDIEPAFLPDGGIVFVSARANRYVNCWRSPVAVMYRCERDGSGLRPVSSNIEHDNTPWPLPDGRVLYMRWEYVDRNQLVFHHLWASNPDGTGQSVFYGNMHPGYAMLDAKPIPGGERVVASFSPGHGRPEHMGVQTIVDPRGGPDQLAGARNVLPGNHRDPFPLPEDLFLAAVGKQVVAFDGRGNRAVLWQPAPDEKLDAHEPRPLKPRPREPVIASRVRPESPTGRLFLSNVTHGRNMAGVAPGEVTSLLVLEQLPKPINFSGGPYPVSNGGTFTLSRVLGTVPVQEDGSAYFEVPALRSVFFVARDRRQRAVKRMMSFVSVQPGETLGCVGCHEPRTQAPPGGGAPALALGKGAARIAPVPAVPDVLDFPRDVQPILDRLCVGCHNPEKYEGRADFSGDATPVFSQAFGEMMQKSLFSDGRNEMGNAAPRSVGSGNSRILGMVDGSHYGARATAREETVLRLWIDSSAPFAGTYGALGSGMHVPALPAEAIERRCGSCHGMNPPPRDAREKLYRFGDKGLYRILARDVQDLPKERAGHGRPAGYGYLRFGEPRSAHEYCNLSRPHYSLLLRAPLAKAAGGLEICKAPAFASTEDADYLAILRSIDQAADRRRREKRFDMPGYVPNPYYLAKMREYGVLPPAADDAEALNPYALDRRYWESFWYRPGEAPPSARGD